MRNKNNVDIILPSYNSFKYVDTTIKSIIKQTFKNWRLIIIDSSSDIKTLKIFKSNNLLGFIVFLNILVGKF